MLYYIQIAYVYDKEILAPACSFYQDSYPKPNLRAKIVLGEMACSQRNGAEQKKSLLSAAAVIYLTELFAPGGPTT